MRRVFAVLALTGLLLAVTAAPALAINDANVPAENCAAADQAVGHPAVGALQETGQITGFPVSAHNPGVSTGAKGQEQSQATEHCV